LLFGGEPLALLLLATGWRLVFLLLLWLRFCGPSLLLRFLLLLLLLITILLLVGFLVLLLILRGKIGFDVCLIGESIVLVVLLVILAVFLFTDLTSFNLLNDIKISFQPFLISFLG